MLRLRFRPKAAISGNNIQAMEDREIEAFIATGRQRHGEAEADGSKTTKPKTKEMCERLRKDRFDSPYRLRKKTAEDEWAILCTAHGILKLAGAAAAA